MVTEKPDVTFDDIAGMAEIDNGDAMCGCQAFQPLNQIRDVGHRDDDVFIDLLGGDISECR